MKFFLMLISITVAAACMVHKQAAYDDTSLTYIIKQPEIQAVEIDALGFIYVLDGNDRISKYDSLGLLKYHVVNNGLGHIHSFDVGNPFKTMVFFRDQQTIVMYDKTLSEIQRIRLIDWNLQDVTAACLSPDNAIWLYDGKNRVLDKMNDDGKAVHTSDPFDVIQPPALRPDYVFDTDHLLILVETGHPLSLFNDFGHYIKPIAGITYPFSISDNRIFYAEGSTIRAYDLPDGSAIMTIPLERNIERQRVLMYKNKVYVPDEKGIYFLKASL